MPLVFGETPARVFLCVGFAIGPAAIHYFLMAPAGPHWWIVATDVLLGGLDLVRTGKAGYCPQQVVLNDSFTVTQHLRLFQVAHRLPTLTHAHELMDVLAFTDCGHQRAGELSGGTRQKLNLLLTHTHAPQLLVLDEPYQGFDWETHQRFWSLAAQLRDRAARSSWSHLRGALFSATSAAVWRCSWWSQVVKALAASTFVTGFSSFMETFKSREMDRRFVLAGYPRFPMLLAKVTAVAVIATLLAVCTTAVLRSSLPVDQLGPLALAVLGARLLYGGNRPSARLVGTGRVGGFLPRHHGSACLPCTTRPHCRIVTDAGVEAFRG
ncbi:ATP-binding cassette domain-containing protein [Streptomyces kanamyceticus]|uniref:ATP-binding cassette domain-containing protein n=1 Tax=Streptomyces kanamyceticus TaxID=1967 RepID=UPI0037DC6B5E